MVSEIKERKQVFMAFTSAFIVFVKGPQNEEEDYKQLKCLSFHLTMLFRVHVWCALLRLSFPPGMHWCLFSFISPFLCFFFLQVSLKLGTHRHARMKSFRGACLCKRKDPFFGENKTRVEILLLQRLHYWHTVYRENLAIIYEEE